MDFQFFEQLSDDEAEALLARYLEVESQEVAHFTEEAVAVGISADFSVESISTVFSWILQSIKPVVKNPDPSMPEWMREAHESEGGLIDFADESKHLVLRASYYLGESFVRTYRNLTWTLGRPGFAQYHMPVVAGFADGDEMAPMLVAENIVRRSLRSVDALRPMEETVRTWVNSV